MKRTLHGTIRLAALLFALLIGFKGNAQLLTWQFYSPASLGTEATYTSTSMATGVEESVLTRGPGIGTSALAKGFSSFIKLYAAAGTTKANALANGDYFQLSVKAKTGFTVSLKSIDDTIRRSAYGCKNYRWNYSLDGTNFTEIGAADVLDFDPTANTNGVAAPQINLSGITDLQNVPSTVTVTLRVYVWGASTSGGSFAFGRPAAANSITIGGTATQITPPLIGWQFGLPASIGNEATYNATTIDATMNTSAITRGPGMVVFTLGRGLSGNNSVDALTKAQAISGGVYYQFSVSAKAGYSLSLTTLKARLRRSAAGANNYRWNYSLDGTNFTEIGTTDVSITSTEDGVTQPEISLATISDLQGVPPGTAVTFRIYNWGYTSVGSGSFAIGRYIAGELTNSLGIDGVTSTVTPVKLLSFIAQNKEANNVAITWKTALEVDVANYELQRSTDGLSFEKIYTATANNNATGSTYSYNDKPTGAVAFYRLKIIDNDGSFKLSNIVKTGSAVQNNVIKIYPNPTVGNQVTIVFAPTNNNANISIYTAEGKLVLQQNVGKQSTQATLSTSNLSKGIYLVQFNNGSFVSKASFIKQ